MQERKGEIHQNKHLPNGNNHERRDITEQEKYQDEIDEFDEAMIGRFARLQDTIVVEIHIEEVEFHRKLRRTSYLLCLPRRTNLIVTKK